MKKQPEVLYADDKTVSLQVMVDNLSAMLGPDTLSDEYIAELGSSDF